MFVCQIYCRFDFDLDTALQSVASAAAVILEGQELMVRCSTDLGQSVVLIGEAVSLDKVDVQLRQQLVAAGLQLRHLAAAAAVADYQCTRLQLVNSTSNGGEAGLWNMHVHKCGSIRAVHTLRSRADVCCALASRSVAPAISDSSDFAMETGPLEVPEVPTTPGGGGPVQHPMSLCHW